jgi:hypothetical protein
MNTSPKAMSISNWTRPLLEGLLVATLAACGGSGQNQSGLILPGTPTATATVAEGSAAPRSTGAAATATPTTAFAPTFAEQIDALERSGTYPALDRSTDIVGPDANKNGVRDDIEAWINSLKVSDGQRKALMQDARATQRALVVDLRDRPALQKVGEGFGASTNCGADNFPNYADFSRLAGRIEAMTANTKERAMRYIQFNAARSGSSTTQPSGNTCEP